MIWLNAEMSDGLVYFMIIFSIVYEFCFIGFGFYFGYYLLGTDFSVNAYGVDPITKLIKII